MLEKRGTYKDISRILEFFRVFGVLDLISADNTESLSNDIGSFVIDGQKQRKTWRPLKHFYLFRLYFPYALT